MRAPTTRTCILLVTVTAVMLGWAGETHAHKDGKGKPPPEVPYELLDNGQYSNIATELLAVVRDQDAWNALWSEHAVGAPPAVDFANELVVGIFLGDRGTTAYTVRIDRIVEIEPATPRTDENGDVITDPDYFVAFVEEIREGIASDLMTRPFVIAVMPTTDGEILFGWDVVTLKGKHGKDKNR